jgi:hypothetical protein
MIIKISQSDLFKRDPDIRFAREYGLEKGFWKELWRRYKLLGYTSQELAEYYELKTKRTANLTSIRRWIWRTEIYSIARPAIDMGAQAVNSKLFGQFEQELIKELHKNIKTSVNKNPKTIA